MRVIDFWGAEFPQVLTAEQLELHEWMLKRFLGFVTGCRCERCALPNVAWIERDGFIFPSVGQTMDAGERERRAVKAARGLEVLLEHAAARMGKQRQKSPHDYTHRILGAALADVLNVQPGLQYDHLERLFAMFLAANSVLPLEGPAMYLSELYQEFLKDPWLLFATQWHVGGRPGLRVDGKLAASLMLTDYPDDVLSSLRAPWSEFIIYIPDQLLAPFKELRVRRLITDEFEWWQLGALEPEGLFIDLAGQNLEDQLKKSSTNFHLDACGPNCTVHQHSDEKVKRVMLLAVHLLAGALALMNEPKTLTAVARKRSDGPKWVKRSAVEGSQYILGRDIQVDIDCREAVREYVAKPRQSMRKVRWPVRGHKRWQAFGPNHAERKLIWLQPYWKGDQTAPMLIRTHTLTAPDVQVKPKGKKSVT